MLLAAGRASFLTRLHPVALGLACALPWLLIVGRAAAGAAIAAIGIAFLVKSALGRDWTWLRTPWVVVALGLWLYLMASGLAAPDAEAALSRATVWVRFIVLAAALQHWVLADAASRRWLAWATGSALAFVVVDTLAQYATGTSLTGFRQKDPVRLSGPFGDLVVGTYLVKLMFPVAVPLLAWGADGPRRRLLAAVAAVLLIGLTILLSGERVPLFHFGLGLALCAVAVKPARPWIIAGLVAVAAGAAMALAADPALHQRLITRSLALFADIEASPYGIIAQTGLAMWQDHPLLGVGARNYRILCPDEAYGMFGPVAVRCQLHPHHIYLEWLVEGGLLGLAGFLALLALWGRTLLHAYRRPELRLAVAGPAIGLVLFLWPTNPSMSFFSSWNAGVFWLALGWALACAAPKGREAGAVAPGR